MTSTDTSVTLVHVHAGDDASHMHDHPSPVTSTQEDTYAAVHASLNATSTMHVLPTCDHPIDTDCGAYKRKDNIRSTRFAPDHNLRWVFDESMSPLNPIRYMGDASLLPSPIAPPFRHKWESAHHMAITIAANAPMAVCAHTGLSVLTPLSAHAWATALSDSGYHFATSVFLVQGMRQGVPIGYDKGVLSGQHFGETRPLSAESIARIAPNMHEEVALGRRIAYTRDQIPFPHFMISPISDIPKKPDANGVIKYRTVHDLSSPAGSSVNDGISVTSVQMSRLDRMCDMVRTAGVGCYIWKMDVKAAFRQIGVRPIDWPFLGLSFEGRWLWDIVLPFGLGSSCLIFEAYSSAANHIIRIRLPDGSYVDHYIDDFIGVALSEAVARLAREVTHKILNDELRMPLDPAKTKIESQVQEVLGYQIDTRVMTASCTPERLMEIRRLTSQWLEYKRCTLKQLQSLIGLLEFVSRVVRPGRAMLSRLYAMTRPFSNNHHTHRRVSDDARADIRWWNTFIHEWNGVSLLYEVEWQTSTSMGLHIALTTDACLTGYGAAWNGECIAGAWDATDLSEAMRKERESMPYLELKALVIAAATWGHRWKGMRVHFECDCKPVVQAISKGWSSASHTAHLLRTLVYIACKHGFEYRCTHIDGVRNVLADALSRDGDTHEYVRSHPEAQLSMIPAVTLPVTAW